MRLPRLILLVLALQLAASLSSGHGGAWARGEEEPEGFVAHEAIVKLVVGANIQDLTAATNTSVISEMPPRRLYLLHLPEDMNEEQFETLLEDDLRVDWAELNFQGAAPGGSTQSFFVGVYPYQFHNQYAWPRVNLAPAHQVSQGQGVIVALLDTGIDSTHPWVAGRLAPGAHNFVSPGPPNDVSDVGNGLDDDGDGFIDEMTGHGTYLAGIIAKVAPGARLLPIKVLDSDGGGNAFQVAQGIYHAMEQGAAVINLSLTSRIENQIIEDAIQAAHNAGLVVVAAAGNLNQQYPASYPAADSHVIGVAATDPNDHKAAFSNFGSYVDLCAPGTDVSGAFPSNAFASASGTSAATAMVAGAAALLRAQRPQDTPAQIQARLMQSADSISTLNPQYVGLLGAGRLNVARAMGLPAGVTTGDVNLDARIDIIDLLAVINAWGLAMPTPADINEDGVVEIADLLMVILNWN